MKSCIHIISLGLWLAASVSAQRLGEETESTKSPEASVPVWQDGMAAVGSVRVDPVNRSVIVSGWVNQVEGAIELLACGPGGKTHETIFVLDVKAIDLQTGLLLLGLKPGKPPAGMGTGKPEGPELDIWVDWEESGKKRSERAEHFVFNAQTKKPLPKTPWVFTGSLFEEGQFKAAAEESYIVTYWDPWAIVNIPLACGANDEILAVNRKLVPPIKTPVTMRITTHKKEGWIWPWKRK